VQYTSVTHEVTIFYWGTMAHPHIEWTCPKAQFGKEWCWHKDKVWNDLTGFQRAMVVHHFAVLEKLR
jgi:hypothetical protein